MKTNSKILISFILLQMSSCCTPNLEDFNFSVKDIEITNTNQFIDVDEGITINQEEYRIKCIPSDSFIELINDLNAVNRSFDRCEYNSVVIKDKIARLTISCSKDIWNTPSGSPLNNNNISFKHYQNETEESTSFSNEDWVIIINNEEHFTSFEWYIEFSEEIILGEYVTFELLFELVNGSLYSIETPAVRFE